MPTSGNQEFPKDVISVTIIIPECSYASYSEKSSCPQNLLPANLGPEMAAPILWAPGKMRSFCRKTAMPVKFLVLGGGGYFGLGVGGGGSADFIFMGAGIFSELCVFDQEALIVHMASIYFPRVPVRGGTFKAQVVLRGATSLEWTLSLALILLILCENKRKLFCSEFCQESTSNKSQAESFFEIFNVNFTPDFALKLHVFALDKPICRVLETSGLPSHWTRFLGRRCDAATINEEINVRRRANGVVRKWGRMDLTGF